MYNNPLNFPEQAKVKFMDEVQGILLAAGRSRRFGADKLSYSISKNEPIAVQACSNFMAGAVEVLAIVRPGAETLAQMLENAGAATVICPNADDGMGTSLAYGVNARPNSKSYLIALADMPWIQPITIRQVAHALKNGAPIAVPQYQGKNGHPVGFSADFRSELLALTGDTGAKKILAKYSAQIQIIPCDDPGILRDVDVPTDIPNSNA
jgi:molybdenum cofactor cytidylyltransferase